jgi:hypothetical protein
MRVREIRLLSSLLWVDVRLAQLDGKWLASADTPHGPSLGRGRLPQLALVEALAPFAGLVDELMESVPEEFYWTRAQGRGLP